MFAEEFGWLGFSCSLFPTQNQSQPTKNYLLWEFFWLGWVFLQSGFLYIYDRSQPAKTYLLLEKKWSKCHFCNLIFVGVGLALGRGVRRLRNLCGSNLYVRMCPEITAVRISRTSIANSLRSQDVRLLLYDCCDITSMISIGRISVQSFVDRRTYVW